MTVEEYHNYLDKVETQLGKCEALDALRSGFDAIAAEPLQEGAVGKMLGGAALAAGLAFGNPSNDANQQYNDEYCASEVVDEPTNDIKNSQYPEYSKLVKEIVQKLRAKEPTISKQVAYNEAGKLAMQMLTQKQKTERCNAR